MAKHELFFTAPHVVMKRPNGRESVLDAVRGILLKNTSKKPL
jgi:hypothetical protein